MTQVNFHEMPFKIQKFLLIGIYFYVNKPLTRETKIQKTQRLLVTNSFSQDEDRVEINILAAKSDGRI